MSKVRPVGQSRPPVIFHTARNFGLIMYYLWPACTVNENKQIIKLETVIPRFTRRWQHHFNTKPLHPYSELLSANFCHGHCKENEES